MSRVLANVKEFIKGDEGATTTEYAVLLAVIGVGVIAVSIIFRDRIRDVFTDTVAELDNIPQ